MAGLLMGADPEVFLKNKEGKFVCAAGIFPGTKDNPHKVKARGASQVDGMAGEFNIEPAANASQWLSNLDYMIKWMAQRAARQELKLEISSTAHFDKEVMDNAPEEAKELGCNPDFNAYTEEQNPRPDQTSNMRTAAGHIHLGWCADRDPLDPQHFGSCCVVVKQLDYFLGVPSVILDQNGAERRKMYGKAGAFRPKPYGVEYRPLSNFWISNSNLMRWAYTNTNAAFDLLSKKGKRIADDYGNLAQQIIDGNKVDDAIALCKELKVAY